MRCNFKVSIIVPVYNTELYLEECLSSILNQTYDNYEVIIIDDGSIDNSYKICQRYCKKDNRFIYIKQKNSGVSAARNKAISCVNGDIIIFLDSDDYLNYSALEIIVNEFNDYDLLCYAYSNIYKNYKEDVLVGKCLTDINEIEKKLLQKMILVVFYAIKLLKLTLLKRIF